LRRLYVLAEGASPEVEEVPPTEALIELVRHSYAAGILKSTVRSCSMWSSRIFRSI
jgi:hypothetical protein